MSPSRVDAVPSPSQFGIGKLWGTIREAIIVADARTEKIVLWNPAATAIFGYSDDEAVGLPLHTLVPERLRHAHREGLARYRDTGHGRYIDAATILSLPAIHRDGSELAIEMSLTPIEGPDERGKYALALIRDVTERKRLENARDDFVAMVAHDLKSPLTVIVGCLSAMDRQLRDHPDQRLKDVFSIMEQSAERANRLIEDLVKTARLEAGAELALKPFDLGSLVARVVKQHMVGHSSRQFSVRLPTSLPAALGDEPGTERVLENLLSNAVKFSAEGQSVEVEVELAGEMLVTSVQDHGRGINKDKLNTIFDKFSRSGRDPRTPGTGLGLYIAKLFVESQGGRLSVASEEGSGATFTFTLPITNGAGAHG
jgi:PAS domain S-box-containing protein